MSCSIPSLAPETHLAVVEEDDIFRSGLHIRSRYPQWTLFLLYLSLLPLLILFFFLLPLAFALSVTGTHTHAAVIIAGLECRADHWTVFLQNAGICQNCVIELRAQPETAPCLV